MRLLSLLLRLLASDDVAFIYFTALILRCLRCRHIDAAARLHIIFRHELIFAFAISPMLSLRCCHAFDLYFLPFTLILYISFT